MTESLILLRWKLCLKFDDIIYFSANQRAAPAQTVEKDPILNDKIRKWNLADSLLFDAVNKTFWTAVDEFGHDRMESEKAELARRLDSWFDYCIERVDTEGSRKKMKIDPRQEEIQINSYILTESGQKSTRCRFLIKSEHEFTKYIWKKQHDELDLE